MSLENNQLLVELDRMRDNLYRHYNFSSPEEICPDISLREMSAKRPLQASDFLAISGLNQVFVELYSRDFLRVIRKYQKSSIHERKLSKDAYGIIDHYKDRLTNLNRRNKNLYMGRITKRHSLDMTVFKKEDELFELLNNKRKKVVSLSTRNYNLFQSVTTLYRETNKQEKELGSYELYLAYPYVEGIFKQDQFALRAPLAYMPVKIVRDKKHFKLVKDDEKDIVLNRDVLLATQKFLQSKISEQSPYVENLTPATIEKIIIPYFVKHGLNIKNPHIKNELEPFDTVLKETFRKQRKGQFHIKEMMVLGRFKRHSSMIQKDMDQILDQQTYNDLLEGLIEEEHLYDIEKRVPFELQAPKINEPELAFLSQVNYSQEQVIQAINHTNKLVIWGPPGTGKSQTITNLIASRILANENVLIVSEKKVALDVIYNRMKDLSRYVMFLDDAEDKQSFYHQLKGFIDPAPPIRTIDNDIFALESDIDGLLKEIEESLKLMYEHKLDGVPIHTLYHRFIVSRKVDKDLTPQMVYNILKKTFKNPKIDLFKSLEKTFKRNKQLKEMIEHDEVISQYGNFSKYNLKMTRSEQVTLERYLIDYDIALEAYNKRRFFKSSVKNKFLARYKRLIKLMVPSYFERNKYEKSLFVDDLKHRYLMEHMEEIHILKKHYDALNPEALKFVRMLHTNEEFKKVKDISSKRKYLFDAFYTGYLEMFEASNNGLLEKIQTVQDDQETLEQLHEQKRQMDIESVEMRLYEAALHLSHTKRIMDIKRILENQQKMSVKGFINHFQMEMMHQVKIWLMTPETVSAILPLNYGMFDTVIFDEASQLYVEKGIPAIYRAKKVVIAGDTKQLRPSSLGMGRLEDLDEYYEEELLRDVSMDAKSLLDLARYKYQEIILNYHYRSRYEELIAFSNHAFYQANLFVSPNQQKAQKPPIEYVYVKDAIFENRRNELEAKKVVTLLKKIFRERQNNESIGVITFNSSQRDLIENLIDEELFKKGRYQKTFERELFREEDGEDRSLFIKNIENVQGDERDIIIFSMGYGRDPEGKIQRRFGWLNQAGGENRLNVAITRAKQKIYFVSSLTPEELKVEDLKSTGPKLLKDYMRYCSYISKGHYEEAESLLEHLHEKEQRQTVQSSELIDDLEKRLKRTEIVHKNIGIGSFKIDIALYDEEKQNYKCAILCDVMSSNVRKDIYHQTNYLKARGWKIFRVFASEYYKDPNKVVREIKKAL